MHRLRLTPIAVASAILLLAGAFAGCAPDDQEDITALTIGSTDFSEPWILAEIVKILINERVDGVTVSHTSNLQGSTMLHQGMMSGDLDLYISWTGTQFTGILEMEVTDEWKDAARVYEFVKEEFQERYDQTWLPPLGFNNTYALAVRADFAEEHGLETSSDLVPLAPDLVVGVDATFKERIGDGYWDMCDLYGFEFKQAVDMTYGLMYRAAATGDVDVIVAYSTDGRIASMNLAILEDDLEFFPPYDGCIVARTEVLDEHPEIVEVLEPLFGSIDEDVMGALNARVDVDEEDFEAVARDFLLERGLID